MTFQKGTREQTSRVKIGDRFERLIVLSYEGLGKYKERMWLCQCDCGNQIIVNAKYLGRQTKSCGCLRRDQSSKNKYRGTKDIPLAFWNNVVQGATSRSIDMRVTIDQAQDLLEAQEHKCGLTGLPLTFKRWNGDTKAYDISTASLDRINSSQPYELGNVMWVHKHINLMKLNHDAAYFVSLCKAVVDYSMAKDRRA